MSSPSLEVHGQLSAKPVTPWPKVLITALMSAVAISIIVLAFSWPTVTSEPKSIPLMIAGPEQQVEMVQDQLEDAQPDLFDITTGDDRDAAVEAIEHRDVYGAIVIGQPVEVLSASANNAATGQILHRVGEQLGQQTGMPVTQTDLIPFSENDPNGAGLGVLSFPMVMGGLAGGIVIGLQVIGGGRKIVAVLLYGVLAGFAVTAVTMVVVASTAQQIIGRPAPGLGDGVLTAEVGSSLPSAAVCAAIGICLSFLVASRRHISGMAVLLAGAGVSLAVALSALLTSSAYVLDVVLSLPVAWAGVVLGCGLANRVVPAMAERFGWGLPRADRKLAHRQAPRYSDAETAYARSESRSTAAASAHRDLDDGPITEELPVIREDDAAA